MQKHDGDGRTDAHSVDADRTDDHSHYAQCARAQRLREEFIFVRAVLCCRGRLNSVYRRKMCSERRRWLSLVSAMLRCPRCLHVWSS